MRKAIAAARGKPHAAVGIFGALAAADHGGQSNVEVAAVHEFGMTIQHPGGTAYAGGRFVSNESAAGQNLPRTEAHEISVPERSYIRATVDANLEKIKALKRNLAAKVLDGSTGLREALDTIGLFVKGLIQARISSGIPPALKPSTIARKGSSVPLINTGQLRASIDTEVRGL